MKTPFLLSPKFPEFANVDIVTVLKFGKRAFFTLKTSEKFRECLFQIPLACIRRLFNGFQLLRTKLNTHTKHRLNVRFWTFQAVSWLRYCIRISSELWTFYGFILCLVHLLPIVIVHQTKEHFCGMCWILHTNTIKVIAESPCCQCGKHCLANVLDFAPLPDCRFIINVPVFQCV